MLPQKRGKLNTFPETTINQGNKVRPKSYSITSLKVKIKTMFSKS